MEFLNIKGSKLKVILNAEDCETYGIDTSRSDFSRGEIRHSVREILAKAEGECGFSTNGDRILVHIYPLPDGRYEMLISRLNIASAKDRRMIAASDNVSVYEEKRGTYRFDNKDILKRAIKAVYKEGVDCDLYHSFDGSYYLHIKEEIVDGISEFEILIEYSERLLSLPIFLLSEYGKLVVKTNAFDYILTNDPI